ncbi:PAS domain-containing sensor histidine kinase [Paraburkholderia caribensis]|uniref:PAS domain-containing sensor histidine kinase n=1 Tax=Paraburkholderia caribensis TaxID=75105 RepID=UPI001CB30321|nr:PAS domain S-box protein [Paraburkholderia caribensis]CAG9243294.1 conserved hypothetical protein [Paraburkholderia caribensis]
MAERQASESGEKEFETGGDLAGERHYHLAIDVDSEFAIFTLDADGRVETWNSAAEYISGYRAEEIIGKPFSVLQGAAATQAPTLSDLLSRAAAIGRAYMEGWHVRKDGTRFWASILITAQRQDQGNLAGFAAVAHDLSERHLIEARLRRSEHRLRVMIDSVQDYAIFMLSPTGEVTSWNSGAERIKGYRAEEIIGRHFSIFYPPENRAAGLPERMLETASAQDRVEAEGWRIRRDGSRFWADVIISPIRDEAGMLQGFTKVTRDMTERKRLEELETVARLATATESAREEEKKRIARELHDDLGQRLTALKLSADVLQQEVEAGRNPLDLIATGRGLKFQLDEMVNAVRRIASDLRPTMLDDLGLLPAVEWQAEDFSRRFGIRTHTNLSPGELEFSDAATTAIFRIVQEALTNVARHAQAQAVTITIEQVDDQCEVRIEDDGVGAIEVAEDNSNSFGLLGIRERVRQLNGTVMSGNRSEGGFYVLTRIPVDTIVRR